MRRVSRKTRLRNARAQLVRDALILEVGRCEVCGKRPAVVLPRVNLWVHEIARGSHRHEALDKRFATLVVCRPCHMDEIHSRLGWPEARQLAVLKRRRPRDYDLAAYNELVGADPDRITEADVLAYERRR